MLRGWKSVGACKSLRSDKSCGPGVQLQEQECIPGSKEKCFSHHKIRNIHCEFLPCIGKLQNIHSCLKFTGHDFWGKESAKKSCKVTFQHYYLQT